MVGVILQDRPNRSARIPALLNRWMSSLRSVMPGHLPESKSRSAEHRWSPAFAHVPAGRVDLRAVTRSEHHARVPATLRVTAGLLAVVTIWLIGALAGWWRVPIVGWVPLPVMCAVVARACWRASTVDSVTVPGRRLWRCLALALAALTVGVLSNLADALLGPDAPTQRAGPVTVACFVAVVLVVLWGLLRLPGRGSAVGGWLMFGLDSSAVVVTAMVFAWHFSFRHDARWAAVTGSVWTMFVLIAVGFVAAVAFVKVASVGSDHIDRGAMRLFALATLHSAATGAMLPALGGFPHITNSHMTVPVACLLVGMAADRQRRAGSREPEPVTEQTTGPKPAGTRPRRWSPLPYAAVAATDGLLLVDGAGSDGRWLAAGAVALTAVVVVRQIVAFAHNSRLLTEVDTARDMLLHQTSHDDLTGLGNRRLLHERIAAALAGPAADPVHLVLIDLDDFKTVNDRLGHHVGDELLVGVARRLDRAAGRDTTVVRLGGDEFAALLPASTTGAADAAVKRLAAELQLPVQTDQYELLIRSSLGITDAAGVTDARELLRRADVAMYAAKDRGKHRVARYEPAMDDTAAEQSMLGAELRRALSAGELELVYQPIVALASGSASGSAIGAEALVRWNSPERGEVPPSVFVPVAERNGLIVPLGEWILREACRHAATWPQRVRPHRVSVNVSARQLREPDFPATVAAILAETALDPARLTLEITETAVFDGGTALASVRALHRLGVSIALDDFGTGHSSLGLLRTCPVDILKVDKSFIDEVGDDGRPAVVAAALINIAEGMHLTAVAEGVEAAAQAERLYDLGYRYAQGFHFARPMPAAEIAAALTAPATAAVSAAVSAATSAA
jgi:diguanylate cyclase (GGDEF)-like protein